MAGRLHAMDDRELEALLHDRDIRDVGIKDFFDLAEKLLDDNAVQTTLSRLDRPTLATLAVITDSATAPTVKGVSASLKARGTGARDVAAQVDALAQLALIDVTDEQLIAYEAVASQLASWPNLGLPSLDELVAPPPATLEPVSTMDSNFTDHIAAERAFATTAVLLDYISELQREPARELARGGIALPDSKRLSAATGVEREDLQAFHEIGMNSGLLVLNAGHWLPSDEALDWRQAETAERWGGLAAAWLDGLPSDIRELLGERAHAVWGEHVEEFVLWLYPAGGEWMHERMRDYVAFAERLGITANSVPSTPGATLLADGRDAATRAMAALFPAEVDKVYLQHDLSIVSTGPLVSSIDQRLRGMADVESRAIAVTYRASAASVNRALAAGETEESITEFLEMISLSGVPQPLGYLIADTAARHGTLRVGSVANLSNAEESVGFGANSYVRSDDANLIGILMADQRLISLSLRRSGRHRIFSAFDTDTVFWLLNDARYAVAMEGAAGEIVTVTRRQPAQPQVAAEPTRLIVERLRALSNAAPASGRAWLERQLDVAIRSRLIVTVTVLMPNGTTIDYLIEPTGLAGGRLRALDRKADIERTLPLASIVEVQSSAKV
jgi:Helicase conserved C-terminal domain